MKNRVRNKTVQRPGGKKSRTTRPAIQPARLVLCLCCFIPGLLAAGLLFGETRYFAALGWQIYSEEVTATGAGLELGTSCLRLPAALGYSRLCFPYLKFDTAGKLTACGTGSEEVAFTDVNGLAVTATGYQLKTDGPLGPGLYLSGSLSFTTQTKEEIELQFTDPGIYLDVKGEVKFEQTRTPTTLTLAGWNLSAGKISAGLVDEAKKVSGTILENVSLTLPDGRTALTFARICLDIDGLVLAAGEAQQPGSIALKDWQLQYKAGRFDNEGLSVSEVRLASTSLGNTSATIPTVHLTPDGALVQRRSETALQWTLGEFQLLLIQYQISDQSVLANGIELTLPAALEKKQLKTRSGQLTASGLLTGATRFDNLELFGFIFSIEKVQFQPGQVLLYGQVLEPYTRVVFPLAEFIIEADGTIKTLTVIHEDKQPHPLLELEWG